MVLAGVLLVAAASVVSLSGMSSGSEVSRTPEFVGRFIAGKPITFFPNASRAAPRVESSTTTVPYAALADPEPSRREEEVDIVLYGTQTSALGVLRAFLLSQDRYPEHLTLAVISPSGSLESPLAQGLSVEDEYHPERASGFYREFREAVRREYETQGIDPRSGSRLTYEPTVASRLLSELCGLSGLSSGEARTLGARTLSYYHGSLIAAEDDDNPSVEVQLADGGVLRLQCRYLIDASVEADLARLLGCDYRLGTSPLIYNDRQGKRPNPPDGSNSYATAPQSLSYLVTLEVDRQTRRGQDEIGTTTGEPDELPLLGTETLARFANSWSMSHPLPNGKRELNEAWSDFRDPVASYQWFIFPDRRDKILEELRGWTLSLVEELKAHGYPELEVAHLPTYPYVRGELMVEGEDTYRVKDLEEEVVREAVAVACYALYDRHDALNGSAQAAVTAVARLPLGATKPSGHPRLLVSTAFSCEWQVYSSAVRMENLRANAGAAVGVLAVAAATNATDVGEVAYEEVLVELEYQGHEIW